MCVCVFLRGNQTVGSNGLKFGMGTGMDRGAVYGCVALSAPYGRHRRKKKGQKCRFQAKI